VVIWRMFGEKNRSLQAILGMFGEENRSLLVILGMFGEENRSLLVICWMWIVDRILTAVISGMAEKIEVVTDISESSPHASPLVTVTRVLKNSHSEPSRFLHSSVLEDNADQILIREFLQCLYYIRDSLKVSSAPQTRPNVQSPL